MYGLSRGYVLVLLCRWCVFFSSSKNSIIKLRLSISPLLSTPHRRNKREPFRPRWPYSLEGDSSPFPHRRRLFLQGVQRPVGDDSSTTLQCPAFGSLPGSVAICWSVQLQLLVRNPNMPILPSCIHIALYQDTLVPPFQSLKCNRRKLR